MVALGRRVSRLEKGVIARSKTDSLATRFVYQPSEKDLAEAVAILVKCGAARRVDTIGRSGSSSATPNSA